MALADLLDAFASNDPVPGGGSAAALAGAVGASLLLMVAGMPKTRTGAPEETADLAEAAALLRPLRDSLLALVDRDSDAYRGVVAALRQPKATDEEKAARREALQTATLAATEVPLDTMRLCRRALDAAALVGERGNPNASSDVGVAIELLRAGLRGARLNVEINLPSLRDTETAARIRRQSDELAGDSAA
jgi:glutamate formiminotransferase/formiminotetrahydrofolate cyclodeaminase